MKNRICDLLGIEKPVISAAMTWITNAEFVAAVSEAGGAGVLGFNAGYQDQTPDPVETAERLRRQIRRVRELTDKPFGVNFILAPQLDAFSVETLKVIREEKPAFLLTIDVNAPLNPEVIQEVKSTGVKIVHRPLSATVENMKQAEALGVDALICTGFEAGGHTSNYHISLLSAFPAIRREVSIPLMAAGGICDAYSAAAVAAMGAEGVYAGTRFVVTEENPTAMAAKQALIDARAEDLIQVPSNPGYVRVTRNETGLEMERMFQNGASGAEINGYYMSRGHFLKGMLLGEADMGIINCSQAINSITGMKTCTQVVDELAAPFAQIAP